MSPCTPDPAAEAKFTTWLVQAIASRTGSTLLEKTPTVVIPEIAEIRAKVGAEPVELEFRGSDQYQSPDDWIANLGYWAVYPKAPVKIPSASHPCAPLWLRIRERVRDGLRARGLF